MTNTTHSLSFTPRFFSINEDGNWYPKNRLPSGKSILLLEFITEELNNIIKEGGEICKHPSDELASNFL